MEEEEQQQQLKGKSLRKKIRARLRVSALLTGLSLIASSTTTTIALMLLFLLAAVCDL